MRLRITALLFITAVRTAALFAQQKEPPALLQSLIQSYRYPEAIRLSDQLLVEDSARPDILLLKARALTGIFRVREAIGVLETAIRYDSLNLILLGELSDACLQAGETDQSIAACRRMVQISPQNSFFLLKLANLMMIKEDYRQALEIYLSIYRNDTTDFYVTRQAAFCFQEAGLPDSAILFCLKAITLKPHDAGVVGRLTNLYLKKEEVNAALVLTTLYLSYDSLNKPILRQNGYCYYLLKEYPTAIDRFRKAFALGDRTRFIWKYMGLSFYKQERYDSAAPFFREAYALDTTDAEITFYYGVSAYRSGLLEEGISLLERTVRLLMPSDQFLYTLLTEQAAAYSAYGEPDTALATLLRAKELLPTNIILDFKIAYQYDYYLRDPWTALGYYKSYLEMSRSSGDEKQDLPQHMSYREYAKNRVTEINRAKKGSSVHKKK